MPKMAEKAKPIIALLKKTAHFNWDDNCEHTFLELKIFLVSLPVIQKPVPDKPILVYLSVSKEAINSVFVQDIEVEQRHVYFVSRMLQETEPRYQMIEKVALALVTMARRMRVYFQNHLVVIKTDYPIVKVLGKPDLVGRIVR